MVKSEWDKKKNTSKQKIIKYLGKASKVTLGDIPEKFRADDKILNFISTHAGENIQKNEKIFLKMKQNLFSSLTKGNLDKTLNIYELFVKTSTMVNFFENLLKPVLYEIGDLWEQKKLGVAEEHVATNIAKELIGIVGIKNRKTPTKIKILLCTPNGEEHHLGCNIIEQFLRAKGYVVYNMAPSVSAETILPFIKNHTPEIILVSITLEDNLMAGRRLLKKIIENYDIPIIVGGQALEDKTFNFDVNIFPNEPIEKLPKLINKLAA